jgi:hypothetical protein
MGLSMHVTDIGRVNAERGSTSLFVEVSTDNRWVLAKHARADSTRWDPARWP